MSKMANEKRLIDVSDEKIKAVLEKVPYYPDEIWKFTAMTNRFPTVDAVEVVHCKECFANGCCSIQIDIGMGEEGFCAKGKTVTKCHANKNRRKTI